MEKMLGIKKKKIARDTHEYANNRAYPRPPPILQSANTNGVSPKTSDSMHEDVNNPQNGEPNTHTREVQPLRWSERLNNNNNNNAHNSNTHTQQQEAFNNNSHPSTSYQQGFSKNWNGQQANSKMNRNQYYTRKRRNQRRR
ncbi:putative uncharacterized protein DDB_G0285119 [Protopterus annectens]|uniref:putative uncharacterized protein DDB_G0285119 n=1 Tax=Protopterus annectens TaxID=7888 RepID=UPI001CFA998B|nr:putative uncharacterized protein DDB_G0285119 [Protopterus annectens]